MLHYLQKLKDDKNITYKELEKITGIQRQKIWRIFNKKQQPSLNDLSLISFALGANKELIDISDLKFIQQFLKLPTKKKKAFKLMMEAII